MWDLRSLWPHIDQRLRENDRKEIEAKSAPRSPGELLLSQGTEKEEPEDGACDGDCGPFPVNKQVQSKSS